MRNRTLGIWVVALLVIAAILFLVSGVFAGGWRWHRGFGMMPSMMFRGGAFVGPVTMLVVLFMLVFWIAIILGIVWLVRWIGDRSDRTRHEAEIDPLDIIRRRYARGEIDREEYERLRQDLEPKP
jgi:putative membrane protein